MRPSDYPPPSYAAYAWFANGRYWLARRTRQGPQTLYFDDTPDGWNELREALRGASDARVPLGPARTSGSNLSVPSAASPARVRLTHRGKAKLDEGDLWEEPWRAPTSELLVAPGEEGD